MKYAIDTQTLIWYMQRKTKFVYEKINNIFINNNDVVIYDFILTELLNFLFRNNIFVQNKDDFSTCTKELEQLIFYGMFNIALINNFTIVYKCRDVKDEKLLNASITQGLDAIISSDKDLLSLNGTVPIKIININQI